MIQNRLPSNLISSAALGVAVVPGLASVGTTGPVPATVGLDKIAENIEVNLGDAKGSSSHARPSMFAHITSFVENVHLAMDAVTSANPEAAYSKLSDETKADFQEWQGMMSAVALREIFSGTGLKLSVDTCTLNSDDKMEQCILMEMNKSPVYKNAITQRAPNGAPEKGFLYYICQDGKPFAIYTPEIGVAALRQYDDAIFDGVLSWHSTDPEDCHKGWTPVIEPGVPSVLDDVCLSRIVHWATKNSLYGYAGFVKSCQRDPLFSVDAGFVSQELMTNAVNIDLVWPGRGSAFGSAVGFFQDENNAVCALPLLYLDKLFITYVGETGRNKLIYNSPSGVQPVRFEGADPALASFAPVAPFRAEANGLFQYCPLQSMTFDPKVAAEKLLSVSVTMEVTNTAGERLSIRKVYDADHMLQGKLPYMMIWPYIPLPQGMDVWHEFYATWRNQTGGLNPLMSEGGMIEVVQKNISFDFDGQGTVSNVYRITANTKAWPVCTGRHPFQYAIAEAEDIGRLGIVFIRDYETYDVNDPSVIMADGQAKLAVDFGTTSTVTAFSIPVVNLGAGAPQQLPFLDYSLTVTAEEAKAKHYVDLECWLGNTKGGESWKWDKKIFSVAQLFGQKIGQLDGGVANAGVAMAGGQKMMRDGRLFISSGEAMTNYTNLECPDPLGAQKIMTDMKFNDRLNMDNSHGATIFLAGIYCYAVLYLLKNKYIPSGAAGIPYLKLLASYPNDVTLNALNMSWSAAKSVLNDLMDPQMLEPIKELITPVNNQFYNEATCTAAYQRDPMNLIAKNPSLISVDIGGGTTDISITNINNQVRELSIRYAGREIMVSSLIEYFRRFESHSEISKDKVFSDIWVNEDNILRSQFDKLCKSDNMSYMFLVNLLQNNSLRMNIELMLANGMHLDPVMAAADSNLLRQLITTKFLMLMRIVARCVRKNYDILLNNKGQLSVAFNKVDINLSVSGASAQLMEYVFDTPITNFAGLTANNPPVTAADKAIVMLETMFDQAMADIYSNETLTGTKEKVSSSIKLHVDPNVREKREVCYGLLQHSINDFAKQGAGPAQVAPVNPLTAPIVNPVGKHMTDAQRQQREKDMKSELIGWDYKDFETYLMGETVGESFTPGLLNYLKYYEVSVFGGAVKANRGLGYEIENISDLFNPTVLAKYFHSSGMAVANTRAQYMVEPAQKDYRDLLANMYIVEEILNSAMAEQQLK